MGLEVTIKYIRSETATLYQSATGREGLELLWGDTVQLEPDAGGDRIKATARGFSGYVERSKLQDDPLLEVYFVDVGQGDGVLIVTPDRKHILIDGGYKRDSQPTGKNAADFVDWKFARDYRADKIHLDAMISSHCDADHYGGLWDLINPAVKEELDLPDNVTVDAFYHAGVGWWKEIGKKRWLGQKQDGFLVQLMEDLGSARAAVTSGANSKMLQGDWCNFISDVVDCVPVIKRLSQKSGYVPGFAPAPGKASIRVLGPVEFDVNGTPGLKDLGSDSQNTNGHSVTLRLDYGRVRILLTGDLNAKSQRVLLEQYTGNRMEFACDVAKACHHGSDDCSYEFLEALKAAATVISSGDNESHAHPRPSIVSASALTGHIRVQDDEVVTPLVYSTEIARSMKLGKIRNITDKEGNDVALPDKARIEFDKRDAGSLSPSRGSRPIHGSYVVSGVIYGLVNVRTDGNKILCATMNENKHTWDTKSFSSRF